MVVVVAVVVVVVVVAVVVMVGCANVRMCVHMGVCSTGRYVVRAYVAVYYACVCAYALRVLCVCFACSRYSLV